MDFLLDVVAQGLAYGILAIGVLLTYQVLDYADLTVEGSFPLGAAVGAIFITQGWNPFVVLIAAFIAGVLAGYATGILYSLMIRYLPMEMQLRIWWAAPWENGS